MSERDYSNDPDDYWRQYPDGQHDGGVTPPAGPSPTTPDPVATDPFEDSGPAGHGTIGPATDILHPTTPTATPGPTAGPTFQPPQSSTPSSYRPPAPGGPAPMAYQTPPITDEVTRILMSRLKDLSGPFDPNTDPTYQQAVKAYQVGALRASDRERKALAERTAAGGTRATGGFNVGVQGINERQGEKATQYRSGLALDRMSAREAQLVDAIKTARAVGQDDIANQLELQRLALQQELGRGDLALREELGRGNLGLGYDQLGYNYADLVTRANRDATLAALGQTP